MSVVESVPPAYERYAPAAVQENQPPQSAAGKPAEAYASIPRASIPECPAAAGCDVLFSAWNQTV
jgi:hypothetical protein